jgi:hypothetical protein
LLNFLSFKFKNVKICFDHLKNIQLSNPILFWSFFLLFDGLQSWQWFCFHLKYQDFFFLFLQELLETNSSTHPKKDLSPKLIHQLTERSELFTILRLNKFIFFLILLQFLTQFGQFWTRSQGSLNSSFDFVQNLLLSIKKSEIRGLLFFRFSVPLTSIASPPYMWPRDQYFYTFHGYPQELLTSFLYFITKLQQNLKLFLELEKSTKAENSLIIPNCSFESLILFLGIGDLWKGFIGNKTFWIFCLYL